MTIVFIDANVANYQSLIDGVEPGTEVVVLDANRDGIAQITEELANRRNVDSVQIFSHGGSGSIQLGNALINEANLAQYQQLEQWQEALSEDADILLYGCNVAEGKGREFIELFSQMTGADVAASEDITGSSVLGGDWELEAATGDIESATVISSEAQQEFASVLPVTAEYYKKDTFDRWAGRGVENDFDKNWGNDKTDFTENNYFSLRWMGYIYAEKSGEYNFYENSDDGTRLWVNNRQIIDKWSDSGFNENNQGSTYLEGGKWYPIQLDFYQRRGEARLRLQWQPPGELRQTIAPNETIGLVDSSKTNRWQSGYGLKAEYFKNKNLSQGGERYTRIDSAINFHWGNNNSPWQGFDNNNFSARWTGSVVIPESGWYQFFTDADDKVKLKIDKRTYIDRGNPGKQFGDSKWFDAEQVVPIELEYKEYTGNANVSLGWKNSKIGESVIPATSLLPYAPNSRPTIYAEPVRDGQGNIIHGSEETRKAKFKIRASGYIPEGGINVFYNLEGLSGASAKDFSDNNSKKGQVFLTPNSKEKIIEVEILDDAIGEEGEQLKLEIAPGPQYISGDYEILKLNDNEPFLKIAKFDNKDDKIEGEEERSKNLFKIQLLDADGKTAFANPKSLSIRLKLTGNATRGSIANPQPGSDYKLYFTAYGKDIEKPSRQAFPDPQTGGTSYDIGVPKGTEYIIIQAEDINDEIFESSESIGIEIIENTGYGILNDKSATANLIDNEPTVELTKVVHPTEGIGFGSTISGLESALTFSGDRYIAVAENNNLDLSQTGEFTQEAWIFSNSNGQDKQGIIGYQAGETSAYPGISIINNSVEIGFGDGQKWHSSTVDKVINPNSWNHLATTFDGTDYKLYVNAVEVFSTSEFAGKKIAPTQQLEIGRAGDNDSRFQGAMDEVRVWNVARSAYEIQSLMVSQLEGNENGLVGYWNLNKNLQNNSVTEDIDDRSNDNLDTGILVTKAELNFDGADDYVNLPDLQLSGDLTLEAEIYVDEYQNWARIFDFGNGAAQQNIYLAFLGDTGRLQFNSFAETPGESWAYNTPNPIPTKEWVHVAATINRNGLMSIYVNGELEATGNAGSLPPEIARINNYIGRSNWVADRYFKGKMREVRVWDVARTQSEIKQKIDTKLDGNEAGLKAYYQDYVALNNTLIDSSQDFDGTLVNATSPVNAAPPFINNPAPQIGYVEVELDRPFEGPQGLWVKYDIDGGSATQNTDYFNSRYRKVSTDASTETDGIIIPQGQTTGRIYFSALADTEVEGDETIEVKLIPHNFDDESQSKPTNSNYGIDASGDRKTITIKDNQAYEKGVILLDEKDRVISGRNQIIIRNNQAQFKVRLSSQPIADVTLNLNSDLNSSNRTRLNFNSNNWNQPQAVTFANINESDKITISADNYLDENLDFNFTIDPPLRVTEGSESEAVAVTPKVSIVSQKDIQEDEGLPGQFILNLSAVSPKGGITVKYELSANSTASLDGDYTLADSIEGNKGSITIPEGETSAIIPIFPVSDENVENNETVTLTLLPGEKYIVNNNKEATLKITNDDLAGIQVVNAQIIEAEETTTRYSDGLIPIITNEPYPTVGDSIELKNEAGTVLATVSLTQEIIDTGIVTIIPTEGFPTDTTLLQANLKEDNQSDLGFSINNGNISLEDNAVKINLPSISDRSAVGIRLYSKPTADVTVSLKNVDDTETSLDKTTLTFTTENWDSYQTVEISGKDDRQLDGNIEYKITAEVTATEDNKYIGKTFSIPLKNLDDDSQLNSEPVSQKQPDPDLPRVTIGDRLEVDEDSNLVEIEVNLSQPATKDTKVVFDVNDDSAVENQDYYVPQQVLVEQKEADGTSRFDSPFDNIEDPGENSQPTFADIDGDGDSDAIVGTQDGIKYYENTGSANSITLEAPNENPFSDIEVAGATPSFGDLNGDGKLDLVLGKQDGTLDYYFNISSADTLRFLSPEQLNSPFTNPFRTIDVGNNANPFLIDFDGDGDLDLIAGFQGSRNKLNTLSYYQNTGSKGSPSFEEQPQHPITEIAAGVNSSPFVVDWDSDGDLDILVAKQDGSVNLFSAENGTYLTGPQLIAASASQTEEPASNIIQDNIDEADLRDRFEINLEAGISYTFDLEGSPTGKGTLADTFLRLYDSDNVEVASDDDGGESYNSRITYTPTTTGTFYVEAAGYGRNTGTYELTLPQENAAKFGATFADTDGDGDLDAFVGTPEGEINYYERFSIIEFAEGEQSKNIRLRIKDDSIAESQESFQVNLVPNTGYEVDIAEVSLKFDGQNDYVEFAHQDYLNVKEQLTIEAEVYLNEDSPSGNRRILQKGNNDDQYRLLIENGELKFDLAGVGSVTAPVFSVKQWHHVAGVYDGSQLKLYVDGEEVSSVNASGEIATTSDNLNIGTTTASAPAGDFWQGEIKEVRIWNVARTGDEIQANRDEILAGLEEELIAYYPGRTNSSNSVVDSSIYNSSGVLSGGATSGNNISTTVAINDNDTAGVTIRSLSDANITSETGDSLSYGVKLDTQPTAPVTVALLKSNGK